jgi:hypothetical protein
MVRSEHLRATSLHAEVAYLKDLKRVGEFKRSENSYRAVLRQSERTFWSETLRAKAHTASDNASPSGRHSALPLQLERMRHAHGRLQQATAEHASAAQGLHREIQQLSSSHKRLETLQKLVTKAAREHANLIESRLSEEITDLVATAGRRSKLRGPRLLESNSTAAAAPPVSDLQRDRLTPAVSPDKEVFARATPHVETFASHATQALQSKEPYRMHDSIQVHQASIQAGDGKTSLSVSCAVGRTGTLTMALVREPSGALAVRLDPGIGTLAPSLLRERAQIQARLQSMGINVTTIEVSSSDSTTCSLSRQSRRAHAEDDEDIIT